MKERVLVPVSLFASCMGYCQIKIINHYKLKLEKVISPEVKLGKKVHSELEEKDKKIPRRKATAAELKDPLVELDITRESVNISIPRENKVPFLYIGRTDKVARKEGTLYIIDDKITKNGKVWDEPFLDKRIQLAAYCEGFTITYPKIAFREIAYMVVQRNQDGDVLKVFTQEYDQAQKDFLYENFETFEGVYNGDKEPVHCSNPNKCRVCGYKDCPNALS